MFHSRPHHGGSATCQDVAVGVIGAGGVVCAVDAACNLGELVLANLHRIFYRLILANPSLTYLN